MGRIRFMREESTGYFEILEMAKEIETRGGIETALRSDEIESQSLERMEEHTTRQARGNGDFGPGKCLVLFAAFTVLVVGPFWFPLLPKADEFDSWSLRCGLSLFCAVALLWTTEALPLSLTAVGVPCVGEIYRVMPIKESLTSFAHPLIFLFLGGFALATALRVHGLDLCCARLLLRLSGKRFLSFASCLFGITAATSMWISNTATTAMILPLALGLIATMKKEGQSSRNEIFLLLGLAFSASIGGLGTIVGSPPNGIVAKELGLDFAQWMSFGIPAVILLLPAMILVLRVVIRPQNFDCSEAKVSFEINRSGIPVLVVFFATATLWACGGWISPLVGIESGYDTLVSLLAVIALVGGRMISWEEFEDGTPWGVLLLFGGGLALGSVLEKTGTSAYLAELVVALASGMPVLVIIGLVVLFTIFLTELASNTAVAALMVPVFAIGAKGMGMNAPMLLIPLGLAASCAFMFPVATAPNALVHATGRIPQHRMLRVGVVLNFVCAFILTLFAWVWL